MVGLILVTLQLLRFFTWHDKADTSLLFQIFTLSFKSIFAWSLREQRSLTITLSSTCLFNSIRHKTEQAPTSFICLIKVKVEQAADTFPEFPLIFSPSLRAVSIAPRCKLPWPRFPVAFIPAESQSRCCVVVYLCVLLGQMLWRWVL